MEEKKTRGKFSKTYLKSPKIRVHQGLNIRNKKDPQQRIYDSEILERKKEKIVKDFFLTQKTGYNDVIRFIKNSIGNQKEMGLGHQNS